MNTRIAQQLEKVLALADSNHEGEALGAVRMARQLLSKEDMTFSDLARAASPRSRIGLKLFSSQTVHLDAEIAILQSDIKNLQEELKSQETHADFWRRRAGALDTQLKHAQNDAEHWKNVAKETLEQLWDMGEIAEAKEFNAEKPFLEEDLLSIDESQPLESNQNAA